MSRYRGYYGYYYHNVISCRHLLDTSNNFASSKSRDWGDGMQRHNHSDLPNAHYSGSKRNRKWPIISVPFNCPGSSLARQSAAFADAIRSALWLLYGYPNVILFHLLQLHFYFSIWFVQLHDLITKRHDWNNNKSWNISCTSRYIGSEVILGAMVIPFLFDVSVTSVPKHHSSSSLRIIPSCVTRC